MPLHLHRKQVFMLRAILYVFLLHFSFATHAQFTPAGMNITSGSKFGSVDEAMAAIEQRLAEVPAIGIIARIDHQKNARRAGLDLPPTQVLLFDAIGLPGLRAEVIGRSPTAAIALPQAILIWEDAQGLIKVGYNNADYVTTRHGLTDLRDSAQVVDEFLGGLAEAATGRRPIQSLSNGIGPGQGLVEVNSQFGFTETISRFEASVLANPALSLFARVDHAPLALAGGRIIAPSTLMVIGNPLLGTPLMNASRTIGTDLPQRILFTRAEDGSTVIRYNDPGFLSERHGISSEREVIDRIRQGLGGLVNNVAGVVTP